MAKKFKVIRIVMTIIFLVIYAFTFKNMYLKYKSKNIVKNTVIVNSTSVAKVDKAKYTENATEITVTDVISQFDSNFYTKIPKSLNKNEYVYMLNTNLFLGQASTEFLPYSYTHMPTQILIVDNENNCSYIAEIISSYVDKRNKRIGYVMLIDSLTSIKLKEGKHYKLYSISTTEATYDVKLNIGVDMIWKTKSSK